MSEGVGLEARLGEAMQRLQEGRMELAHIALAELVSEGLESADVFRILASIDRGLERHPEAVAWLERALVLAPREEGLAVDLVIERLDAEDYDGALQLAEALARQTMATAASWEVLGRARRSKGRLTEAKEALDRAKELEPDRASLHNELGQLYRQQDLRDHATTCFQRATQLDPKLAMAWANLGSSLAYSLDYRADQIGGMTELQRALDLAPKSTPVRLKASSAFVQLGHLELAEKCLQPVLKRHPEHEEALACLANSRERSGDYRGAVELVKPFLKGVLTSTNVALSYGRSCLRLDEASEGLAVIDQALQVSRPEGSIRLMQHLRGDCLARLGRYEDSLNAHGKANALVQGSYRPEDHQRFIHRVAEGFPAESFERRPRAKTRSPETILVVGMPRSGTSLVEQILSSHPKVCGLGELPELRMCSIFIEKLLEKKPWHQAMDGLNAAQVDSLGRWYRSRTRQRARGEGEDVDSLTGIVDKLPTNFVLLGLAAQILPGLRIVHTRRNPLDSCLSCYTQSFGTALRFATRMDWLGAFYRDYAFMMRHWEAVLPEPIFDVQYEDIVTDPEPIVRGLLEHCGLDWDPAVLEFHRSKHRVNTASYHQVHKPIYTTSVNKHRPYLPWLGELVEALGETLGED